MKTRKWFACVLVTLMVLSLLTACGASSMATDSAAKNEAAYDNMAPAENVAVESPSATDSSSAMPMGEKFIINKYMDVETEDMDALLTGINAKISELGGYLEGQEIYNGSTYNSRRYRNAYLTVRIPADCLDSFVSHIGERANVVSERVESQNVTLTYVATESRIKALQTEEARLLELLAMAENMDDLLMIEARLTEVRTELEEVTSTLRALENKVDYSTIYLNIEEVREFTDTQEPETVWERIGKGFSESMKDMSESFVNFFVYAASAIPHLIPFAVVALIVILIVRGIKRRKKKKNQAPNDPPAETK